MDILIAGSSSMRMEKKGCALYAFFVLTMSNVVSCLA